MSADKGTGYKCPPKSTRFKSGQSGNPRGRPKGTRNLKTDLNKLLKKRITVRENGEVRQITRQEAMLLGLFSKAVRGDVRAANSIVAMVLKLDPPAFQEPEAEAVSENDESIVQDFLRRKANENGQPS